MKLGPKITALPMIVGPTPSRPPMRFASTAPSRNPIDPIENARPSCSAVNPRSGLTRYRIRIPNPMLLNRFEIAVQAAMLRRYGWREDVAQAGGDLSSHARALAAVRATVCDVAAALACGCRTRGSAETRSS